MAENRADLIRQIEQEYEQVGVPVDTMKKEFEAEKNEKVKAWAVKREENLQKSLSASRVSNAAVSAQTIAADIGMGTGTAFVDINRNLSNGIIGIADTVDNTLQEMGITRDDLITDKAYFKDQYLKEKAEMGDVGKAAHAIYKVAVPMALGAAATTSAVIASAPVAGGLAIDAAYSFFAADPNGGRLSDALKDTWVENVPLAGSLVDTLSTKPSDSEMTGRLKNVAEGLGIGSSIAMLFNIGKARTGYNKLKGLFNKEGGVVSDLPPSVPPAGGAAQLSEAELAASDAAISVPPIGERAKAYVGIIQKNLDASPASVDDIYEDVARFRNTLPDDEKAAFNAELFGVDGTQNPRLKAAVDGLEKFEAEQIKEAAHMSQVMGADQPLVEVTNKAYVGQNLPVVSRKGLTSTDLSVKVTQEELNSMNIQVRRNDMKTAKDGSVELSVFIDDNGERYVAVAGRSAIREADFVAAKQGMEIKTIPNSAGPTAVVRPPRAVVGTPSAAVTQVAQAVADREINLLKPLGAAEFNEAAAKVVENPKILTDALEGKVIGRDKEHLIKWYVKNIDDNMFELARYVSDNPTDTVAQARLAEMIGVQSKLSDALNGMQGRKMLAPPTTGEFLAEATGQSQKTNIENMGREGRAHMVKSLVDRAGGTEAVVNAASSANMLRQLEAIQNIPDTAFTQTGNGVRLRSRWNQYTYAVNQTMVSSLLSITGAVRVGILNTSVLGMELTSRYFKGVGGLLAGNKTAWREARMFDLGVGEGIRAALPTSLTQITGGEVVINGKTFTSPYDKLTFMPALPTDTGASIFGKVMRTADIAAGTVVQGLGKVSELIPNLYGAFDNPHKYGIYTGNMRVQGFRLGQQLKLEGDALKQFIDDFAVGRIGAANMESPAVLNRWVQADELATKEAGLMTGSAEVTAEPFTYVVGASKWMMNNVPVVGTVAPFMRATSNQIMNDLRFTPAQLARTAFDIATRAENGDKDALLQISRVAVGSIMMGTIYELMDNGVVKGDAEDWGTTNALRTSKAPNGAAILVGDTWMDLSRMGYVSNIINSMAHLNRARGHMEEEEYKKLTYSVLLSFAEVLSPQILLETMGSISDLATGRSGDFETFAARSLANRVPLANIANTFTGFGTDTAKSTDGDDFTAKFKNYLLAKVPVLNQDMRPVLNYWGEEVKVPNGLGMNVDLLAGEDAKTRAVQETLTRFIDFNAENQQYSSGLMNTAFPLAPKNVKNTAYEAMKFDNPSLKGGAEFALTVDEQWNYQKIAAGLNPTTGERISPEGFEGKTLKEAVVGILNEYKAWDKQPWEFESANYAMMLIKISEAQQAFREQALNAINNNPIIQERMKDEAARFGSVGAQVEAAGGLDVGQ